MIAADFIRTAEHLLTLENEAAHRSAASRAYYATFLTFRQLSNIDTMLPQQHHLVEQWVSRRHPQLFYSYRTLRNMRNVADYDLQSPMSRDRANALVTRAKSLLEQVQAPLAKP